jgi:hypothetical protein
VLFLFQNQKGNTMSKIAQLRERRNAKAKDAQDLNAKFPADQRMQNMNSP